MRYVAVFLLLMLWRPARAQIHIDSILKREPPRVILKLAPLTLLELQNTLEAGVEVRLNRRLGIQGQVGYGPEGIMWQRLPDRYYQRENWRGRLELRWYRSQPTRQIRSGQFPVGRYVALDLLYKQLNAVETYTVGRDCPINGGCAYYQRTTNRITRYIGAVSVKWGRQWVIDYRESTADPRWLLDAYVGVGLRLATTERPGSLPNEDQISGFLTAFDFNPFTGRDGVTLNVPLGLKVGYVIK